MRGKGRSGLFEELCGGLDAHDPRVDGVGLLVGLGLEGREGFPESGEELDDALSFGHVLPREFGGDELLGESLLSNVWEQLEERGRNRASPVTLRRRGAAAAARAGLLGGGVVQLLGDAFGLGAGAFLVAAVLFFALLLFSGGGALLCVVSLGFFFLSPELLGGAVLGGGFARSVRALLGGAERLGGLSELFFLARSVRSLRGGARRFGARRDRAGLAAPRDALGCRRALRSRSRSSDAPRRGAFPGGFASLLFGSWLCLGREWSKRPLKASKDVEAFSLELAPVLSHVHISLLPLDGQGTEWAAPVLPKYGVCLLGCLGLRGPHVGAHEAVNVPKHDVPHPGRALDRFDPNDSREPCEIEELLSLVRDLFPKLGDRLPILGEELSEAAPLRRLLAHLMPHTSR